jgi:hypothetical protein
MKYRAIVSSRLRSDNAIAHTPSLRYSRVKGMGFKVTGESDAVVFPLHSKHQTLCRRRSGGMADTHDSKSCAARHVGSTPTSGMLVFPSYDSEHFRK